MKKQRVAVTGGVGFIGSNLVRELALENNVVVIDDLSTGKIANLAGLLDSGKVKLTQGSILDLPLLQKAFQGVDFIFHLGALVSVPNSIKDPLSTNEVNCAGTLKILLAAWDNHVKKVVFSSSAAVYGDSPVLPQVEDMPLSPLSAYAVSKLAAEYYCQVFHRIYQLPTACLRYFNVYGPRQDPNSQYAAVIPRFIALVRQDKPPVIYGDGQQTRDFLFVMDAVQANLKAAESRETGTFNIGTGRQTTVNELAQTVIGTLGRKIAPVYQKARTGDIVDSLADIRKAGSIGYVPRYSLAEGLKQTIDWFEAAG